MTGGALVRFLESTQVEQILTTKLFFPKLNHFPL